MDPYRTKTTSPVPEGWMERVRKMFPEKNYSGLESMQKSPTMVPRPSGDTQKPYSTYPTYPNNVGERVRKFFPERSWPELGDMQKSPIPRTRPEGNFMFPEQPMRPDNNMRFQSFPQTGGQSYSPMGMNQPYADYYKPYDFFSEMLSKGSYGQNPYADYGGGQNYNNLGFFQKLIESLYGRFG